MPEYVNYNPDVLSCLANLSNDEVFTPPEIANAILDMLPQKLFEDPNAKFLDPACKTGVFLREIAKRLLKGLEKKIPNLQERIDHIFHEQLYAIAITELTALMSRRSVYCSKAPDSVFSVTSFENKEGNIRFRRTQHSWDSERKGAKCIYCGASREQFDRGSELETHAYEFIHREDIYKMKFDLIISNPPYQLDDGGAQASAKPIYNLFVDQSKKLKPRFLSMIIPARWYAGGKNLDDFRLSMINDEHISELHDFTSASDCFSGVEIKGGICYFLWDRNYTGLCKVVSHSGNSITSIAKRRLVEKGCDSFIRYNQAISILHKVQLKKEKSFADLVHPAMTFGFRTFFKEFDSNTEMAGMVKVYANHLQGFVDRKRIIQGKEFVDKWKVFIPEAVGSGNMQDVV